VQVAVFFIRLYLSALTLALSVAFLCTGNVGPMQYVFVAGCVLYLTLDLRQELREIDALEHRILSLKF